MTATIPSPATVPHKPWRSGFCNPSNDADSHRRCAGEYDGRPCRCGCHVQARIGELVEEIEQCADLVIALDLAGMDAVTATQMSTLLNGARNAVARAQSHVTEQIGAAWKGPWKNRLSVPGVGNVRPYQRKKTTWRDDALASEVVTQHMRASGGEAPDPMTVVEWLKAAVSFDYWRISVLKELGINVDDFRDEEVVGDVRLSVWKHSGPKTKETDQ